MTEIILTSGSSWTVPDDCTSATVECIGGGQGGNATNGGNGGDYAKANAVALTPGASIAIAIGAGGAGVASGSQNAGGDTSFGSSVLAKGGGSASVDVGDTTFAGGAGNASGAGGGAAGPSGAGGAASGTTGGQGDGAAGGAGGTSGNAGAAGTEWGTAGSGGGGGAQSAPSGLTRVAVLTSQPTSTSTGVPPNVTFTNVQKNDTIVVLSYLSSATGLIATVSDTAGNVYNSDVTTSNGNAGLAGIAHAVATADAASLKVTVNKNKGSFGNMVAYLLRGAPVSFDAANSFASLTAAISPSSVPFGPYSTTGRAFIAWIEGNHQTGGDAVTASGSALAYTVDLAADNSDYVLAESVITGAVVSSDSFTVANANTATAHAYYALGIFNY